MTLPASFHSPKICSDIDWKAVPKLRKLHMPSLDSSITFTSTAMCFSSGMSVVPEAEYMEMISGASSQTGAWFLTLLRSMSGRSS